jgi:hypothetical protein
MSSYSKTYLEKRMRQELTKAARANRFLAISEKQPGKFRLRCPHPKHKAGRERTPSLWVNVGARDKRFFSFKCFGCSFKGTWPDLAPLIKCDPIVDPSKRQKREIDIYDEEAIPLHDPQTERKLLGKSDLEMPEGLLWPDFMPWRTIDGPTIAAVNGVIYVDNVTHEDTLAFPVIAPDGTFDGYVKANIKPVKGVNYFNAPGMSSTKSLLFGDVATEMLRELNELDRKHEYARLAFISEGPRDALTPLMYGYPSVCNLGAHNSWTKDKVNLLLALGIDLLISCMDGDQPGLDAADAIIKDASDLIHIHNVTFPSKKVIDKNTRQPKLEKVKDLSDLDDARIDKIVIEACKFYGKKPPPYYDWSQRRYILRAA